MKPTTRLILLLMSISFAFVVPVRADETAAASESLPAESPPAAENVPAASTEAAAETMAAEAAEEKSGLFITQSGYW